MSEEVEKDKCVVCGVVTPYNKTDDVNIRKNYVEGAGQLCDACFSAIYGNSNMFTKQNSGWGDNR